MLRSLVFLVAVAYVSARCANDCNGKGTCNSMSACECFRNFYGPDCSKRLCQYGRAFVDSPIGDSNGDNDVSVQLTVIEGKDNTPQSELYHKDYAAARSAFDGTSSWDEAHFYRECSNKGTCDASTGLCTCFPGYEGSGCARTSCPNGCSGHGTCKNYAGTTYAAWDKEKSMYCDCDAGYDGPGCENRVCPSGVDPIQASNMDTSRFQRIAFRGFDDGDDSLFPERPFGDVHFTLTLTDEFGDEWTTEELTVKYDVVDGTAVWPRLLDTTETVGEYGRSHVATSVQDALEGLPHGSAGDVTVHEIYTQPNCDPCDWATYNVADDSDIDCFEPSPYDWTSDDASGGGVLGCGVAIVDANVDDGSEGARDGNQDIDYVLSGNAGSFVLLGNDDGDILADVSGSDWLTGGSHVAAAYYQYPHYDNADSSEHRFPVIDNDATECTPEGSTLTRTSKCGTYTNYLAFDAESANDEVAASSNDAAGLALFVYFGKSTQETQLRADWSYKNGQPGLIGSYDTDVTQPASVQEGCTSCDNSGETLIAVDDFTSLRVWDTAYWGRTQGFIGQDGYEVDVHSCSKRGLCDYSTGLCSCFSGYTGNNCGIQNALAY